MGKPEVENIEWSNTIEVAEKRGILLAIQKQSEHPLSEPVVRFLEKTGVMSSESVTRVESITGRGIKALAGKDQYYIGNMRLMEECKITIDNQLLILAEKWQNEAKTVFFFADTKSALSVIAVSDKIKESSVEAIKQLHDMGIDVYMLTGDNEQTAKAIAAEAGITGYKSEALPQDKYDFIKDLQKQGKIVAMAGDGINDSQALAQADVSIAMGNGSDLAIEVAKMTIISSDLLRIPQAIRLSKYTVKTIRQNLFWAFIYNVIGIPVAAGILFPFFGFLLNPMIAGAAMALSSVSVVSNSLRLKVKPL